jgi:hypothetical protein
MTKTEKGFFIWDKDTPGYKYCWAGWLKEMMEGGDYILWASDVDGRR